MRVLLSWRSRDSAVSTLLCRCLCTSKKMQMNDLRYNRGRDPIRLPTERANYNLGWTTGVAAAALMIVICVFALAYRVDWIKL